MDTLGQSPSAHRRAARLDGIAPTIFAEMSALATRTGALNLGQGFPDADGPPEVVERAARALADGANQYPPGIGIPELRRAVSAHQERHHGLVVDPDEGVVVTTGATEAIAAALLGLLDPGDEVVLLEPWYDSYAAMISMCGAVRVPVTLRAPDFRVDLDAFAAAITPRTRMILLNTPHNPTGTVLNAAELTRIAELANAHDLVVVCDEVYEHLTYDGVVHTPIATLPGMAERTLRISSVGKSFSLTGWKVGWATGPRHLVEAVTSAKQWLTYTSGAPLQPAVAFALDHHDGWPLALAADLQERRDMLCAALRHAGLDPHVPSGTYFVTTDVADLGWRDGREFALALPGRAGVVAVPTQGFHDSPAGKHLVRWAFCKSSEVLTEAAARLAAADLAVSG